MRARKKLPSARPRSIVVAEPPAAYQVRPPLVVDASVINALLFDEPARDQAHEWMRGRRLFAPQLLDYEVANVTASKMRKGLDTESADAALRLYESVDIDLLAADCHALPGLALRYALSAYDAAYLWLAAELKAPLATFDHKLGKAAQQHLGALE